MQIQETRLVSDTVVVAMDDLTLQCSKMNTFSTSAGVCSINDRIPQLDIQQIELNWIIAEDILIRKEKLFSECENS